MPCSPTWTTCWSQGTSYIRTYSSHASPLPKACILGGSSLLRVPPSLFPTQSPSLQHYPDYLASWGTLELIKATHISPHEGHICIERDIDISPAPNYWHPCSPSNVAEIFPPLLHFFSPPTLLLVSTSYLIPIRSLPLLSFFPWILCEVKGQRGQGQE